MQSLRVTQILAYRIYADGNNKRISQRMLPCRCNEHSRVHSKDGGLLEAIHQ